MQKIMPDTIQEWHAEDVIFEAFLEHFGYKTTKIASKHAPQRRVYARSVQKGLIDGTHGIPSRNGMPRMSFLKHFCSISDTKPQKSLRNTRHSSSLWGGSQLDCCAMEPFFNHFGCKTTICLPALREVPTWVAQVVVEQYIGMKWRRRRCGMPRRLFLKHFGAFFWRFVEPEPTKIASKHAPQRRVYARSVQKGPIDGTH
eukprot:gene8525-biopygen16637